MESSAGINLGLDYCALGQHERARSSLEETLERVRREAVGTHRWRWKIRLLVGLATLLSAMADDQQALRSVEAGLHEARATSSQKYSAKGQAVRGTLLARLGQAEAAHSELQHALALAESLHSPSLFYPIAYHLGYWYESRGQEREAITLYKQAQAGIEHMATAVEDTALRALFLGSTRVQAIDQRVARLGG